MNRRLASTLAVSITSLLIGGCATPIVVNEPDISFEEAYQLALLHSDPVYELDVRSKIGTQVFAAMFNCLGMNRNPVGLVVAINADGRPRGVYVNPPTRANKCLQKSVRKLRLSEPPFEPFFTTPIYPSVLKKK